MSGGIRCPGPPAAAIMSIKPYLLACMIILTAGCVPQAELVQTRSELTDLREESRNNRTRIDNLQKHLDAVNTNAKGATDVQKVMADYGAKTDQLTTDIQLLQGKLEENNFRIADLSQKLDDKSFKITELSARVDELESKLKALAAAGPSTGQTGTVAAEKKSAQKTAEPSEAYRLAKADYDSGNIDLALAGFQNFLVQFPDTSLASSAQYWIGECYYAKKEYSKAIEAFSAVVKTYPKSDKVPGAKLKIGYSYLGENHTAKAKEWLNKVVKEYPGTQEAELAKSKLHKIGK